MPFDGYLAELHRGEMVLTALEARAYRAEEYANYGMMAALSGMGDTNIANDNRQTSRAGDTYNVDVGGVHVPGQIDPRRLVGDLSAYGKRRARGRGKIL